MKNNRAKITEIVEQFYLGNYEFVLANVHEEISWITHKMPNAQPSNKQEVKDFFDNVPQGRFTLATKNIISNEQCVIAEGICTYKNEKGKLIENNYCDIFTFVDNKIKSVSSYFV